MEKEETKQGYYEYLCKYVVDKLEQCHDIPDVYFERVKRQMIVDLLTMFEDRAAFEGFADALRIGREEKRKRTRNF